MITSAEGNRREDNVVLIGVRGARRPPAPAVVAEEAPGAVQRLYELWLAKDEEVRRPPDAEKRT